MPIRAENRGRYPKDWNRIAVRNNLYKERLEVRCEICNRLLGVFEKAKGQIKCPRCKHVQKIDLKMSNE
jgi:Zn finger protein HypA/HybF involved in hydrogenase expression